MDIRTTWAAVVITLGVALRARASFPPCLDGTFDIAGPPLVVSGSTGSDTLQLQSLTVATTGGCPTVNAKVRGNRLGTKVKAKWAGCAGVAGPHRLTAVIDATTCNTMLGTIKTPGKPKRSFVGQRQVGGPPPTGSTWDIITSQIFGVHGCAVSTCHGPIKAANLDLRPGLAYANLVNASSTIAPAKKRIVPGNSAVSFLSQKVHGTQATGEGTAMPLIGQPLSAVELQLLDAWIDAGAPPTGNIPGEPVLPPLDFVPAAALPVPPGGYQVLLNGPTLQPGEEQEGCLWTPIPWTGEFLVGQFEFSLNPGTHHFAVYQNRVLAPPLNQWLRNDYGCFGEGDFYSTSGAAQAPYYVDAYPPGVARSITGGPGRYLGLNAHYRNYWNMPIQIKVWVNVHPFSGTPQHHASTLYDLGSTFGIYAPPFAQTLQIGRFTNTSAVPLKFFSLSGHMHKRGLRFTAYRSDGTKLYDNFDWAHPLNVLYDPPLELAPGDWIDYECLHDNGVTRAVKRDALGNPIAVQFGVTTDDEMCILPGSYYTD